MIQLPLSFKQFVGPSLILIVMLMAQLLTSDLHSVLAFSRTDIEHGQLWKLLSANLVHTNIHHLMMNIAAVVVLWALHGQYFSPLGYICSFLICGLFSTTGILLFTPEFQHYAGASGALHGLLIMGAVMDIQHKLKSGWILVAFVLGKIVYEQITGPDLSLSELINATVAIDAHLYGAVAGCLLMMTYTIQKKRP